MSFRLFNSDTESSISDNSNHSVLEQENYESFSTESSSEHESDIENNIQNSEYNQENLTARTGRLWSKHPPPISRASPADIVRETMKCTQLSRGAHTILEIFQLLITRQIIDIIVVETNRKGLSCTDDWNLYHPDEQKQWVICTAVEISAFIGLLLLAGVYRSMNESLQELWSRENGRPIFRATMNLHRFNDLLRFLRFDDFNTRQIRMATDKLAPIRELWRQFLLRLARVYVPSWKLTIDEQLVVTRGRCPFRQYIPSKPGKYGIKIFWLCDSINSFPLFGEVYLGRQPGALPISNSPTELVMRLSQPWLNSGRNITGDNYFTSIELTERLLNNQTTYVGTIRKNKKDIPSELQASRNRKVDSSIFCFNNKLTLVSYVPKTNKSVILLSSMHHTSDTLNDIHNKPEIINFYNQTKSGVDNFDHLARVYSCKRKTKRWPMTLFFNILDCAAIASYNIWILRFPNWDINTSHRGRNFIKELSGSLIGPYIQQRLQNPHVLKPGVRAALTSLGYQLPVFYTQAQDTDSTLTDENTDRKRCVYCIRGRDRKTKTLCSNCKVPICSEHQMILCPVCTGDI